MMTTLYFTLNIENEDAARVVMEMLVKLKETSSKTVVSDAQNRAGVVSPSTSDEYFGPHCNLGYYSFDSCSA